MSMIPERQMPERQIAEFVYDGEGRLVQLSRAPEPICPKCGEPVQWCLDMFSLTTGSEDPPFAVAHARCVWAPEAFEHQGELSAQIELAEEAVPYLGHSYTISGPPTDPPTDPPYDGHTIDVGPVHVLEYPHGPCAENCPHPDHLEGEAQ